MSGELVIEANASPCRIGSQRAGSFSVRGRPHAFRNAGNQPARVLILCAPSCSFDQMFAELQAAMQEIGALVAIAAKYGVAIEPPADCERRAAAIGRHMAE